MICDQCQRKLDTKPDKRGADRVPNGWKRWKNQLWCKACWNSGFVLRAFAFPVASPVDMEWKEFREKIKLAWQQSTRLANWTTRELAKADIVRDATMEKLPAAPRPYLYPGGRLLVPDMSPSAVVAVQHAVSGKYNKERLESIWRGSRSLSNARYPTPYTVPAQAWSARWLSPKERVPIISLTLSSERIELRLRGSGDFTRQLKGFEALLKGEALQGSLDLYRQRASGGDHRSTLVAAAPAGGQAVHYRIMAKLMLWIPRAVNEGKEAMTLATGIEHFWKAELPFSEPWVLHADHVRRWIAAHRTRLNRLSTDSKYEKRWPQAARLGINDRRKDWCDKQHRRLHSWCHEASAMVIQYALRHKVKTLTYDDSERNYVSEFPWAELSGILQEKCQFNRIEFCERKGETAPDAGKESENI